MIRREPWFSERCDSFNNIVDVMDLLNSLVSFDIVDLRKIQYAKANHSRIGVSDHEYRVRLALVEWND
jgi:hypothetical protein